MNLKVWKPLEGARTLKKSSDDRINYKYFIYLSIRNEKHSEEFKGDCFLRKLTTSFIILPRKKKTLAIHTNKPTTE